MADWRHRILSDGTMIEYVASVWEPEADEGENKGVRVSYTMDGALHDRVVTLTPEEMAASEVDIDDPLVWPPNGKVHSVHHGHVGPGWVFQE